MSLRTRIALILLTTFALFGGLDFLILQSLVIPSFSDLEEQRARKDLTRSIQALQREVHHLNTLAYDYAAWDATYAFVEDGNEDYINANLLETTFTDNDINLLYIIHPSGRVVWGETLDDDGYILDLPSFPLGTWATTHPLLAHDGPDSSLAGVTLTSQGPMLVASRPILTSEDQGPARGTLVMGRFLTEDLLETLRDQTQVEFSLWPLSEGGLPPRAAAFARQLTAGAPAILDSGADDVLYAYDVLADYRGQPGVLIQAASPRDLVAQGRAVTRFALFSTALAGVGLAIIIFILLRQQVVEPLTILTQHASAVVGDEALAPRARLARNDEIGRLAREIDRMMERLGEARAKLLERSYWSGRAEMASGVLHNVRNALTPLMAQIETLRNQFGQAPIALIERAQEELAGDEIDPGRRADLERFLELAQGQLATLIQTAREELEQIQRQSAHVEDILAAQDRFAYADQPLENVRLANLVHDALGLVPGPLRGTFTPKLGAGLSTLPPIRTNRVVLVQVLTNLFKNAAESIQQAAPEEGAIRIDAHVAGKPPEQRVHLVVADNGMGFSTTDSQHMFERGYTTKADGGTGIGLHWCANALTALGASIHAEPGEDGAEIHIALPMEEGP